MNIQPIVQSYLDKGMVQEAAESHAASEIFLNKIAESRQTERVTLKGGVVMYNLSGNVRRATTDLDFDFIHYSIEDESILLFIRKLNSVSDGIEITPKLPFEELRHQDYRGKRVFIEIKDKNEISIKLKLDIGVHTYNGIPQRNLCFSVHCCQGQLSLLVNPNEQIFTEKIISLAKIGAISARFKDIYDIYYLIKNQLLEKDKVNTCLSLFLDSKKYDFFTLSELYERIEDALNDPVFSEDACKPKNDWIDENYQTVKETLLNYIYSL